MNDFIPTGKIAIFLHTVIIIIAVYFTKINKIKKIFFEKLD